MHGRVSEVALGPSVVGGKAVVAFQDLSGCIEANISFDLHFVASDSGVEDHVQVPDAVFSAPLPLGWRVRRGNIFDLGPFT